MEEAADCRYHLGPHHRVVVIIVAVIVKSPANYRESFFNEVRSPLRMEEGESTALAS